MADKTELARLKRQWNGQEIDKIIWSTIVDNYCFSKYDYAPQELTSFPRSA